MRVPSRHKCTCTDPDLAQLSHLGRVLRVELLVKLLLGQLASTLVRDGRWLARQAGAGGPGRGGADDDGADT